MVTGPQLLLPPLVEHTESLSYVLRPRPRRSFRTVLDASDLIDPNQPGLSTAVTRVVRTNDRVRVELTTEQRLRHGTLREHLVCEGAATLSAVHFERTMADTAGAESRHERVDFTRGPLRLPGDTYPEVALPFLLRGQPFDRLRRSVHSWITDRMVARVYYEVSGRGTLEVPAGRFDVWEVLMYPDLNDWVNLPQVLATLSKPFLPKYHMAYETRAPHRLVRFEGPYGPPGAPEIILELT